MSEPAFHDAPAADAKAYRLFRDYFELAEKNRRWSLTNDIPWDAVNPDRDPALADVIQTFSWSSCSSRTTSASSSPRSARSAAGRGSWPTGGTRSPSTRWPWATGCCGPGADRGADGRPRGRDVVHEWNLPHDNPRAMVIYTAFQELATQVHYRNMRRILAGSCPALDKVLRLISVDEAAHGDFFRRIVSMHLEEDREATVDAIRRVISTFQMPAITLFAESGRRAAAIKELAIFDDRVFFADVLEPLIGKLGVTRAELRRRTRREWAAVPGSP